MTIPTDRLEAVKKLARRLQNAAYSHGIADERPDASDAFYARAHDKSDAAYNELIAELSTPSPPAEPVAWLHDVVHDDNESDQALSFSPDNFPLHDLGCFRSIGHRPLYLAPPADRLAELVRELEGYASDLRVIGNSLIAADLRAIVAKYNNGE